MWSAWTTNIRFSFNFLLPNILTGFHVPVYPYVLSKSTFTYATNSPCSEYDCKIPLDKAYK
jgi:hypothetical protein